MAQAAIRIEELHKVYRGDLGKKPVIGVDGLNLDIDEGQVFAFLGPNGAGKTTTIKLITRLLFPDRGKVWILGLSNTRRKSMQRVGYMPEQPNLYGYLTGLEFMDFTAGLFGLDSRIRKERIARLLERVGLGDGADRLIRGYSRGMVQRLGMAQALVNDPAVLILDEPLSALDPVGRKDFRDLIFDLKKQGKTIFFSSHILSDAEMVADRVGILRTGKLVQTGKLDDLLSSQVLSVEVTCAFPSGSIGDLGAADAVVQGNRVMVRLKTERELPGLLQRIASLGGIPVSVVPVKKSLEDVFLDEMGR